MPSRNEESELEDGKAMTAERVAEIIDTYGARTERWPSAERTAARLLLRSDPRLQRLCQDAAALDAMLGALPAVDTPVSLSTRLQDAFEMQRKRRILRQVRERIVAIGDALWPGVPVWKPASAVALSLVLGLTAGAFLRADVISHDAPDYSVNSPLETGPLDPDLTT
jgi:hypothetical protein